jgi:predicted MPP superfamily phosphohydrolase
MPRVFALLILAAVVALTAPAAAQTYTVGDTLTVIQKPLPNLPSIVRPGDTLTIGCDAPSGAANWTATLVRGALEVPLTLTTAVYEPATLWWRLECAVPEAPVFDLYDLRVTADGVDDDTARRAVKIVPEFRHDFTIAQITDIHLPTYLYYYQNGADTDSSTSVGLRRITEDLNIINPEFVVFTGDLIHEGELEDYLDKRYYSRALMHLNEFEVPTFVTAGNHDIGGWDSTPPSDGTARRNWWRFFGWKRLDDPPAGAPAYTQDYSFDYGPIHFTALEAYDNYDGWRYWIYGAESFTSAQMSWLQADIAASGGQGRHVLLHHYDFGNELNLSALGIDLALWGHVHSDNDDTTYPMDVGTDNASGTNRPFRLVRFSGTDIEPLPTLEATFDDKLRVRYLVEPDGVNAEVSAQVINGYPTTFPRGLLRIAMPGGASAYDATGGTLTQVDDSGEHAVCYVELSIPAAGTATVTVTADTTGAVATPDAPATRLLGAAPNPFNPATAISFVLAEPESVRLTVFDVQGHHVARLCDARMPAGRHDVRWDGRTDAGLAVPSGVYLVGLRAGAYTETRKLVLAR